LLAVLPHGDLESFDTVGWIPDMTYNVFVETLNLTHLTQKAKVKM